MLNSQTASTETIDVTHRMGSLTVFIEPNEDENGWIVPAEKIGKWICRYNEHWIRASGIDTGKNLHWCYDRSVTLRGKNIYKQREELVCLTQYLKSQELSPNWIISLEEFLSLEPSPIKFLKSVKIKSITLVVDKMNDEGIDDTFVDHLCQLYDANIQVMLSGYMDRILECGLLERPEANRAQVSMINRRGVKDEKAMRVGFRTSCQSRIQLVVGGHGYIYPCMGLAGLDFCALGHIDDPFQELFQNDRNEVLDINHWVNHAPDIPEKLEAEVSDGIVLDCYFHREALIEKHRE